MLFWIFVIALIIGIVCWRLGIYLYQNTKYDTTWLEYTGLATWIISAIAVFISLIIIISSSISGKSMVATNKQRYEMLTYQIEHDIYENDNDIGKKELYNQIQNWNEDLAHYKAIEKDFWIGIYTPNVFDEFEFIKLPENTE